MVKGAPSSAPGRFDILNCTDVVGGIDCTIDGETVFSNESHGGWAELAPGPHTITCEAAWKGGFGKVTQTHHLQPGQNIVLYYSAPWTLFSKGVLAPTPQPRRWAPDWRYIGTSILLTAAALVVFYVLYLLFGS